MNNSTQELVYQTTGWVYNYTWNGMDNSTWTAFLMYQLYLTFVLLNEALLNYKRVFIWILIFIAIASNFASSIAGFFLLDCLTFNEKDKNLCETRHHVYYFFTAICFNLGYTLLFYRKYKLVPDETLVMVVGWFPSGSFTGALDMLVLLVCCGLNIAATVPCLYKDLESCFDADIHQAIAASISFLYFEVWFIVSLFLRRVSETQGGAGGGGGAAGGVAVSGGSAPNIAAGDVEQDGTSVPQQQHHQQLKQQTSTVVVNVWDILQLPLLTGSLTATYLAGSWSFKSWNGNFYTNLIWNMGYCLLPLYCIDAIVTPKFLKVLANNGRDIGGGVGRTSVVAGAGAGGVAVSKGEEDGRVSNYRGMSVNLK
ncbi:hypothetical protein BDR26DRAFT_852852 [Obelidium mucronatum]|nr:hypothetical protein BDR26DRAFT_852852 [Obelidium mucronatum]